jgi:16S rRNA (guanine527-N7)-methyltransferase
MKTIRDPVWEAFRKAAVALDVPLDDEALRKFQTYTAALQEVGFNITAIRETEAIITKFHLDSLALLAPVAKAAKLSVSELRQQRWRALDVGSGAGAPGLPWQIACPHMQFTLVDSIHKKMNFLHAVIQALALPATAVQARAETLGHNPAHREQYDLAMARAVAALPTLVEYALPFARVGGLVALSKGPKAQEECDAARRAIATLGGELLGVFPLTIPGDDVQRTLVLLRKQQPTPSHYPRRTGIPTKRPL